MEHTHLLTPDRKPMTDQTPDTVKHQLGEPMSLTEVIYRNVGEGLFTGAEMTQGQLHHQHPPQDG